MTPFVVLLGLIVLVCSLGFFSSGIEQVKEFKYSMVGGLVGVGEILISITGLFYAYFIASYFWQ